MRGLNAHNWRQLVNVVHKDGNDTELDEIKRLLKLDASQEMEALAARANATRIVRTLHDPSSLLLDMLMAALKEGKLCVVDVSQMSLRAGFGVVGADPAPHIRPQPRTVHRR